MNSGIVRIVVEEDDDNEKKEEPTIKQIGKRGESPKRITFSPAPFAAEVFRTQNKAKFDDLEPKTRQFVKKLIETGNLDQASKEAGISKKANATYDPVLAQAKTIQQALIDNGFNPDKIARGLFECFEAKVVFYDKHRARVELTDLKLRLKTAEVIMRLFAMFPDQKEKPDNKPTLPHELFKDTDVEDEDEPA